MMKFKQLRSEAGDCTAPYEVTGYKSRTVEEFVQEVIHDMPKEWGYIDLQAKDCPWYSATYRVEYRWGEIVSDNIPANLRNMSMPDQLKAWGGWSQMNYTIPIPE